MSLKNSGLKLFDAYTSAVDSSAVAEVTTLPDGSLFPVMRKVSDENGGFFEAAGVTKEALQTVLTDGARIRTTHLSDGASAIGGTVYPQYTMVIEYFDGTFQNAGRLDINEDGGTSLDTVRTSVTANGATLTINMLNQVPEVYEFLLDGTGGVLSLQNILGRTKDFFAVVRLIPSGADRSFSVPLPYFVANVRPNADGSTPIEVKLGTRVELAITGSPDGVVAIELLSFSNVWRGSRTLIQSGLAGRVSDVYLESEDIFVYDPVDITSADDGVNILVHTPSGSRFARINTSGTSYISPRTFGAKGDGITDDTAAMRLACNYVSLSRSRVLDLRGGSYVLKNTGSITSNIITINGAYFKAVGDNSANIKVAADCGNYRAIFAPPATTPFEIKCWEFDGVGFDKNSQNNVVTDPGNASSGRYSVTTYTTGYISGAVIIRDCQIDNSDAIVDFYFPELGTASNAGGTLFNKLVILASNTWDNARLGGSTIADYDQSFVNISAERGVIIDNAFLGESWARSPRTAIESHCNTSTIECNVINKFQVGINMCMGLRWVETQDDMNLVQSNIMEISRAGIYIWNFRFTGTSSARLAGQGWAVKDNQIEHRWTQYAFGEPRLAGIEFFISASNALPINAGVISGNSIVYDLPAGTEAHARVGQTNSSPAIGWYAPSTTTLKLTNMLIEDNVIINSPAMGIGFEFGDCSNLVVRNNTLINCGISGHGALSTVYRRGILFSAHYVNPPLFDGNRILFTDGLVSQGAFYIRNRSVDTGGVVVTAGMTKETIIMRRNMLEGASVNYLTDFAGMAGNIWIDGDVVPTDTTAISNLPLDGSWVLATGNNKRIVKNGTVWEIANTVLRASRGTTAQRPTLLAGDRGYIYFDTTLVAAGKPVWWTGTAWVDGLGATV
jgi:hypothetical protein